MCTESNGFSPLIHPVLNNPEAGDSNVYQTIFSLFHLLSLWSQSGAHRIQKNQINDFTGHSISCRTEIRLVSQCRQMSEQGVRQHHPQPWHPCRGGGVDRLSEGVLLPSALPWDEPKAGALLPMVFLPSSRVFPGPVWLQRKETLLSFLYTALPLLEYFAPFNTPHSTFHNCYSVPTRRSNLSRTCRSITYQIVSFAQQPYITAERRHSKTMTLITLNPKY